MIPFDRISVDVYSSGDYATLDAVLQPLQRALRSVADQFPENLIPLAAELLLPVVQKLYGSDHASEAMLGQLSNPEL